MGYHRVWDCLCSKLIGGKMPLEFEPPNSLSAEPYFVGRSQELLDLYAAFSNGARAALISGPPGIGKTALAYRFLLAANPIFPGGVSLQGQFVRSRLNELVNEVALDSLPKKRSVIVINDAESLSRDAFHLLYQMSSRTPELNVILTSRDPDIPHDFGIHTTVRLGPLTTEESANLLRLRIGNAKIPPDAYRRLCDLAQGNPVVLHIAAMGIREGKWSWDEFLNQVSDFQQPGILGPDGKPIRRGSLEESRIVTDVTGVNDELLRIFRSRPELLRSLPPRRFEEVIAQILTKLGYTVTLTPASGDGGFDVYAAKKEALGSFLFLVECKRYVPPNKVGVEIVRSLHGVVQSSKATAGIIATTSFFTSGAHEFQSRNEHQLHLKDYLDLQEWLKQIRC
jgi:restriction system protein